MYSPPRGHPKHTPTRSSASEGLHLRTPTYIAPTAEQYRSRHKAILVPSRSNIGSAAELYRWAHRAREGIEASSRMRSRHYSGRAHSSSRAYHKYHIGCGKGAEKQERRASKGEALPENRSRWQRPGGDAGELSESSYLCRQISNDYLC